MKKIIYLFFFITTVAFSQTPEKISYQAVVRDAENQLLSNQSVGIRVSILSGSNQGNSVYQETHTSVTNSNGLLSFQIGNGTVVSGNFETIDWGNGPYFIKTETDPTGGTSYSIVSTSQFLSVPYALYAKSSGTTAGWSLEGNEGTDPTIQFIGTTDNSPLNFRVNNEKAGKVDGTAANTFLGYQSGNSVTTGLNNTSYGFKSLFSTTQGNYNTAMGNQALYSNTTGTNNTANGNEALYNNTTAIQNTAIGFRALYTNSTGIQNTAVGAVSLFSNSTGNNNVAVGKHSLYANTVGNDNSSLGYQSLMNNISGNNNVAIGKHSLFSNVDGSNNTALGYMAYYQGSYSNSTAIGYGSVISADNQIRFGNSEITSIGGQVGWTTVSDKRFKREIREVVPGLSFIAKLRPVTYVIDHKALASFTNTPMGSNNKTLQTGFIAQEVEAAARELGFEFSGVDKPKNDKDYYGLRYAEFVVPLVKAIQEQQTMLLIQVDKNTQLEEELKRTKEHQTKMEARLKLLEEYIQKK